MKFRDLLAELRTERVSPMTNLSAQRLADRYIAPDGSEPRAVEKLSQRDKDLRTVTEFIAWAPQGPKTFCSNNPSSQTAFLAFSRLVGISRAQLMRMARGEK